MTRTAIKTAAAIGAAALTVLAAACSDDSKASSGDTSAAAGAGKATLTVDGKDQTVSGDTGCVTTANRVVIAVGDQSKGLVGATLVGEDVETLGIILNGQPLGYTKGVQGSKVTVTKDGSSYKFSGELAGMPDMSNPTAGPSNHSFSMDVSCPS